MNVLNRILVATDFSAAGRLAVTRAGQLASQYGSDLLLVHATPDWNLFSRWTSARQEHYDEINLYAQRALRHETNWLHSTFEAHARGEVQLGKASQVVRRVIASYQPNLVVLGARGEHEPRISPAALGGTTLKLVLQTDCPLLLVRGWDLGAYKVSLAAIHEACDLSRRVVFWGSALVPGGQCHILHAYDAPYMERMRLCGVNEASVASCLLATEKAAQSSTDQMLSAAAPGARVTARVVHGNPLGALVTEIALYGPQLVVLGKHEPGYELSAPGPVGALALRMAYHTPVDVLVVP
jgi:nucleotide-binding universal stress UspA family protein